MEVLTNLLKRDPTIEDFKKVVMASPVGIIDWYYLSFDNMKLGKVTRDYGIDGSGKMSVVFTPFEMDQFLEQAVVEGKVTFK